MELGMLLMLLFGGGSLAFGLMGDGDDGDGGDDGGREEGTAPTQSVAGQTLTGVEGEVVIEGGSGDDTITGLDQLQYIEGYAGDDLIEVQGEYQLVWSGTGDDTIVSSSDTNSNNFFGGDGADSIEAGDGDDVLYANGGDSYTDYLSAFSSASYSDDGDADTLSGDGGDDLLFFSSGDTASGGSDVDTFYLTDLESVYDAENPATITDYEEGEQIVVTGAAPTADLDVVIDGDDAIVTEQGRPVLVVEGAAGTLELSDVSYSGNVNIEENPGYVETGAEDDLVTGSDEVDRIATHEGNDTIDAGAGYDYVFGGGGDDVITLDGGNAVGGGGADTITGGDSGDYIYAAGGDGEIAFVEYGGVRGYDDDGAADVIDAGDGNDSITFSGSDTVTGGAGTDSFFVDVDGVIDSGSVAVLTDYESGEFVMLYADTTVGTVAVTDVNGDAVVSVDGVDILVAEGAGGTLTESDITTTVY